MISMKKMDFGNEINAEDACLLGIHSKRRVYG